MTEWFLKLLGAHTEEVVRIAQLSLAFRGGWSPAWVLLLIAASAAGAYWLYRQSPTTLSPTRQHLLFTLRFVFLTLLLLLFLRPVLSLTVEGSVRRILILLADTSASMQIQDPRVADADLKRAAIAAGDLNPVQGLNQTLNPARMAGYRQVPRLRIAKHVLQNEDLNLLPRLSREFDLAAFAFGDSLSELATRLPATHTNPPNASSQLSLDAFPWTATLTAERPVTALGDAIREVLHRKRGQPLAGMLVLTDGANNSGMPPREAASLCRQEGLPLYFYGVGITDPRDLIVANLFAPEVTFVKDEVPVTVRLRSQGLAGQEAQLLLKLEESVVAAKSIRFEADGEMVVPVTFTPRDPGEFNLTASIDPMPEEAVRDNNSRATRIKVIDARIKVLLTDQSPRWEFRYLQAMLLRDRRVNLKCWLADADPLVARIPNSPYLEKFPSRKEELFEYDLIVLGDLDPKIMTGALLENVSEHVSRFGGALVVLAGKRFMPHAYRRGLLENLLPVEYDSATLDPGPDTQAEKPVTLQLTAAGRANPMFRLSDNDAENIELWKALPPIYWAARVSRPKPAAEVLLVDPDPAKESRFGKMPVVASQQYGLGQVLFVGTDNTWRWRKNVGDVYYTTLWGQIAQRLSLQRLLGVSKRTQLTADRQTYLTGDRVTVFARLYSSGFEPLEESVIKAFFHPKSDPAARSETLLRPIPEQAGLYRGEFIAPAPGEYSFAVEHDPTTTLDLVVTKPQFEFGATAMNEPLLRDLAQVTGGAFFREEDLHALPDTIRSRTERVRSPLEVELWSSPFYFLLLLGTVTAEWLLRKWSYLK